MSLDTVIQLITTVGFPIAMCVGMAWYVKYITDKNREEIKSLNTQHQQEMCDVTVAINNNTLAIQKLCDSLDK